MGKLKYPIGIQSFEKLREGGYLYVDKTELLFRLVDAGQYYFLSRPRRFGKSLMISTLEAIFQGKRHLFKGLAIDSLYDDWQTYEVLHLDLNSSTYADDTSLISVFDRHLRKWENAYGISPYNDIPENRLIATIEKAYEISCKPVVVLVDEYDKPLLAAITNPHLQKKYRRQLQGLFSVLKTMDKYIKFGMLTGVSRFSKVSIFSSLNNLRDISLESDFNCICGISEDEISSYFQESMRQMADRQGVTPDLIHNELKKNFDGYHFAAYGEDIYNPFSLLNTFSSNRIGSYWLATGTTSSLLEVLNVNTYPIRDLEGCRCNENQLNGADIFLSDPIPFFFQSGYLTIKDYDPEFDEYILGFPNLEVSKGFNDLVLRTWMRRSEPASPIRDFVLDVRSGNAEEFMTKLQSFFAGIPYDHSGSQTENSGEGIRGYKEVHYQNVMFVIMKLMGLHTHTEIRTSDGRMDMLVETSDFIYVMEFKIDSSPEKALDQINDKRYTLQFRHSGKKIFKIGANFSTGTRRLTGWIIEQEA